MSKRFLGLINLTNLTSDPATGTEGDIYWDSSTNKIRVYDGTVWSDLTSGTGSTNSFTTISVSGQSDIVADSTTDTLTLIAGTNVGITTNATNDSITINSTGNYTSVDSITYPDYITFDTTPETVPTAQGSIYWDSGDGLPKAVLNANVELGVGQEQIALVKNATGATIDKGKVVYINGAAGQRPTIALADSDLEETSSKTLGLTAESIANGAEGFVTTFGVLRGVNTDGLTEGSALWLSSTAGGYQTDIPAEPAHLVFVGYVVKAHETAGEIFVNPQNGYELTELHGVTIDGTPADNEVLAYDSTSGIWINQTASEAGLATSSHTHNYAGSSSAGGAANSVANSITFDTTGGAASGTTFDGSSAKTIDYSTVGAASSSHTHTFSSLTSKPTTVSGYGITDAIDTSSTSQTKTGDFTSSGNLSGTVLVSSNSLSNEGGQIELALPSSGSTLSGTNVTIDVYQNKLRFFESGGSNRGFYLDISAGGSVVGTNLAAGGSSYTAPTLAGTTLSSGGTIDTLSGTLTADKFATNNNGAGTNFKVGDDAWIGDVNLANTVSIQGQQNSANGYILFGTNDGTALGRAGTGALTYGGNTVWHAGNDGAGSGLDADTLDGNHASAFATSAFTTIATTSGTSPVADSTSDTLTLSAGTGITVTGDSTTDTVTIAVAENTYQPLDGDLTAIAALAGTSGILTKTNTNTWTLDTTTYGSGITITTGTAAPVIALTMAGVDPTVTIPFATASVSGVVSTTTQTFAGDKTFTGDLAVNGGDITTTSTTATLFNSNATTLNIGGASTAINISSAVAGAASITAGVAGQTFTIKSADGTAVTTTGGGLTLSTGQGYGGSAAVSGNLTLTTGTTAGTSGSIIVDPTSAGTASGSISIGATNASAITVGRTGTTLTIPSITAITNTTASSAYTDGALVVSGGLGVAGKANFNGGVDFGAISIASSATGTISSTGSIALTAGTTSSTSALTATGNGKVIRITGDTTGAILIGSSSSTYTGDITIDSGGGANVVIEAANRIKSATTYNNTTTSAANMNVSGSPNYAFQRSTSRYQIKQDINPFGTTSLTPQIPEEKIGTGVPFNYRDVLNLTPVSFKSMLEEDGDRVRIGFIAQDIAEKFPEVATFDENGEVEYYEVNAIVSCLLAVIQELDERVKTLEAN